MRVDKDFPLSPVDPPTGRGDDGSSSVYRPLLEYRLSGCSCSDWPAVSLGGR